jgi:hypothetical protein
VSESVAFIWGTTPEERERVYPCDDLIESPDAEMYRGITIHAPAEKIYRWLCQLRLAPYSYDWVDNLGRRSPRVLQLDGAAVGQRAMHIFRLVSVETNRHLTMGTTPNIFGWRFLGDFGITYMIVPENGTCRLLGKLVAKYPRGPVGWVLRLALPWGDMVMMRKQLLNFKELAEG